MKITGLAALAVGAILLTGCASTTAAPTTTPTPTGSALYAAYRDWYNKVAPDLAIMGQLKTDSPAGCADSLNKVQQLDKDPLPPIAPADWTNFVGSTESALAACQNGDLIGEAAGVQTMSVAALQWERDLAAVMPGSASPTP
jgi:hypothetical protein